MCVYRVSHSNQLPFSQKIMEHFLFFMEHLFITQNHPYLFLLVIVRLFVNFYMITIIAQTDL